MKIKKHLGLQLLVMLALVQFSSCTRKSIHPKEMKTVVTIVGQHFYINGEPTYKGRKWTTSYGGEYPVEGLLMNTRIVHGIFDDLNPETRGQWAYPDTKEWDPNRNTDEFIDAMASWKENGLLAFTINLQGGCPYGYCRQQPWDNSAFAPDGALRPDFMNRLERLLNRADDLGMVVILGYFYFGQDENLNNEEAVITAVKNATQWVLEKGYRNVIVEINNECNGPYDHEILQCNRVHELINIAKKVSVDDRTLYVGTSLGGGHIPPANIVGVSDYVLLHGNSVSQPGRMEEMIRLVREMDEYSGVPIVNNEDDRPWLDAHQGWEESGNNFVAAVKNYASWGYFDFRLDNEQHDFNLGYQSIPVNWHITTKRKQDFFDLCADITGSPGTPKVFIDFSTEVGKLEVRIEQSPQDVQIKSVDLVMNNEIIATLTHTPYVYEIQGANVKEQWIKARVGYLIHDREVSVESFYHKNPWWPYGGPEIDK